MNEREILRTDDRREWRKWLQENFEARSEIWLVFPSVKTDEKGISYNDAVEEALCFGWIDGRTNKLDDLHLLRRFTPRRKGSSYSRINIERLINMEAQGLIHPNIRKEVIKLIKKPYRFPRDILKVLKKDRKVWENYLNYPESYKRIRIAYIDAARKRPEEFEKRLNNFIRKTRENKLITGYGGIEKYYEG